uniref:Uncharacterized protein n=1 Tax=Scleropages formosus TaxID=113540 RepID=A0A8C9W8H3_SCLFO
MPVNSLLILAALGTTALSAEHVNMFTQEEKRLCDWECMTLALLWPGAFCVSLKYNTSDCVIPKHIQNWTIHGLWPLKKERCCDCWPIFPSDLTVRVACLKLCVRSLFLVALTCTRPSYRSVAAFPQVLSILVVNTFRWTLAFQKEAFSLWPLCSVLVHLSVRADRFAACFNLILSFPRNWNPNFPSFGLH